MRREGRGEERRGTSAGYKGWGKEERTGKGEKKRRKNRSREERKKKRDFNSQALQ